MTGWLDPLRAALDAREEPVTFFFRDDDAGWDDPALEALLDVFEPHGLPLDVAAIPLAATARTVELITSGRTTVATTSGSTSTGSPTSTTSRRDASASSA